ncbi:unnamed protein product, partial [Durusdinium trenchii]
DAFVEALQSLGVAVKTPQKLFKVASGFSQPISLRREERLNSARSLGVRSLSAPSVHAPEIKRTLTFKGIYTIQMDGLNIEDEL